MNSKDTTGKEKQKLGADLPAIPCGLVAKSFFNDTFELHGAKTGNISIDTKQIAWSSDVEFKFKNIDTKKPEGKTW